MIVVLRLGHRPSRDKRVTTHVALTARAFGAAEVWVSTKDAELEKTVNSVVSKFGGEFAIRTGIKWRDAVRLWKGKTVHLTMYGQRLDEVMQSLKPVSDLLVVVGAEKVPRDTYDLADWNVSIGNQPHSEIAALAVIVTSPLASSPETPMPVLPAVIAALAVMVTSPLVLVLVRMPSRPAVILPPAVIVIAPPLETESPSLNASGSVPMLPVPE